MWWTEVNTSPGANKKPWCQTGARVKSFEQTEPRSGPGWECPQSTRGTLRLSFFGQRRQPLDVRVLPRRHFRDLQFQQRPALPTYQRTTLHHVDFRGIAADAGHGGVRRLWQGIGRHDSGDCSARQYRRRLESGAALGAHVIEAAIGRATVEHFGGTTYRASESQLSSLHATS